MASESIEQRVHRVFVQILDCEPQSLHPTASLVELADSLGMVELVLQAEDEFDIDIPDEDLEPLRTFGDCVAYLTKRCEGA